MRRIAACLLALSLGLSGSSARAQQKGKNPPRPARSQPAKGKPGKAPPAKGGKPAPRAEEKPAPAGEAPEIKAAREAERELFPQQQRAAAPSPLLDPSPALSAPGPEVSASGLPAPAASAPEAAPREGAKLAWMQNLKAPDLPVRWDERVVKYLQFFHDDPRGRGMAAIGWRRWGRYRDMIRSTLQNEKLPQSLVWVAMTESGFDPKTRSHAGAVGMWQFMPDGGRLYGLRVDRWMDERQDPVRSTQAAARYFADLHRRFGSWELALAAYNMGFGGLLTAIRKYNTNDFWELTRHEAGIPWETTLYVPKIIALAIVAENPQAFGLDGQQQEAPLAFDVIKAPPSLSLDAIARASGASQAELLALNPHLVARRTPPAPLGDYDVRLPEGKGAEASMHLSQESAREPRLTLYTVRPGQSIASLASDLGISRSSLADINGLAFDENPAPGEAILIPASARFSDPRGDKPVVVAPASPTAIPGKRRVFYRVIAGDSLAAVASAFRVAPDDLRAWNHLDPSARLQDSTTLQIFIDADQELAGVAALPEQDVRILTVGTEEFFTWFEAQKGRRRITVTVGQGETWKTISSKYGISIGLLERINRKAHTEPLKPGDRVVVYTRKAGEPSKPALDEAT